MSKNPISVLQELMAAKKQPLPIYYDGTDSLNKSLFTCKVHVCGVEVEGSSTTKKGAKHESARKALEIIFNNNSAIVSKKLSEPPILINKNFVGELNEKAAKSGLVLPNYEFQVFGIEEFAMICHFLEYETRGIGRNKKDAKQDAAKQMLHRIDGIELIKVPKTDQVFTVEVNDVIQKFSELVSLRKEEYVLDKPKIHLEGNPELDEEEDSIQVLEQQIKDTLKIPYKIRTFSSKPHTKILEATNNDFTVMAIGDTDKEALRNVLQQCVLILKHGCSLLTK